MEVWKYGSIEIWKYGSMEIWKYGNMETKNSSTPHLLQNPKWMAQYSRGTPYFYISMFP